jgi:hypothetical protein
VRFRPPPQRTFGVPPCGFFLRSTGVGSTYSRPVLAARGKLGGDLFERQGQQPCVIGICGLSVVGCHGIHPPSDACLRLASVSRPSTTAEDADSADRRPSRAQVQMRLSSDEPRRRRPDERRLSSVHMLSMRRGGLGAHMERRPLGRTPARGRGGDLSSMRRHRARTLGTRRPSARWLSSLRRDGLHRLRRHRGLGRIGRK